MYIVTGATGHIGNNVVRYLTSLGIPVKVLVRKLDPSLENLNVNVCISPYFDDTFLDINIAEGDIIIHCAAYIDLMNRDLFQSYRTNVQLTKKLVNIAIKKKNRFVYLSSVDVLPRSKKGLIKEPLDLSIYKSKSYYKTTKSIATKYVMNALHQGLDGMILYPSAVVGIHDYKPSAAGRELLHIINHKVIFSLRGGYNFIDVQDIAKAVYQASISSVNDHIILSGHDITIRELYEKVSHLTKQSKWIFPLPTLLVRFAIMFSKTYSQMMITTIHENYHYDHQKMTEVLGISPTPLDDTLLKTIKWLDQHYPK
jgi:dihydroflavonol-4-reductase